LVPGVFLLAMAAGALAGASGVAVPVVEPGIASSVLCVGLLLAFDARLPLGVGAALVAVFAIFHGFAHGAEMAPGASLAHYGAGFLAATVLLHAAGVAAGRFRGRRLGTKAWRFVGTFIAGAGVFMLAGLA
jgi:urease accessory protein